MAGKSKLIGSAMLSNSRSAENLGFGATTILERGRKPMSKVATGLLGAEYKPRARNALSGRFMCPPFTTLNAREGWWQERKRAWIGIGIRSELGRGENLLKFSDSILAAQRGEKPLTWTGSHMDGNLDHYRSGKKLKKTGNFKQAGKSVYLLPPSEDGEGALTGTSIFDPVLCEIAYRWFCPLGGTVLDPFSGGSVRGIVAGELGLYYVGCDLSSKQVEANHKQGAEIGTKPCPVWLNGDSRDIAKHVKAVPSFEGADFIFSCPPYGSLEKYSDDPSDISSMTVEDFTEAYFKIITESCALLKPGRFACFVVGDYRNKEGFYENLPAKTIVGFEEAGLRLYNEAILITSVGSLSMRINKQFGGSRKLGKSHQNILVFAKGNPKDFISKWPGNLMEKIIK